MKIYIKKVPNLDGTIKESLWIRFNHQGGKNGGTWTPITEILGQ